MGGLDSVMKQSIQKLVATGKKDIFKRELDMYTVCEEKYI